MSKRLYLGTSEVVAPTLKNLAGRGSGTSKALLNAKACPSTRHMTAGR